MTGGVREGAGRNPHEPTKASRDAVRLYAAMGTTQEDVARLLKIDVKTLHKYYREELDLGMLTASAQIGGALYKKAMSGDTTAMIFWLKTRAGFRELRHEKVNMEMPQDATPADKCAMVLKSVTDGAISPEQGQVLIGMIKDTLSIVESTELVKRLEEIEKLINTK